MESDSTRPLNIYLLTLVPFPFGLAQTNRLISMTGGLAKAGCRVKVICLKPTENSLQSQNINSTGSYNGIEYVYPSGTTYRGKNPARRIYLFLSGLMNTTCLLIKENRKNKIDFIFMGVVGFVVYLWFYIISRILQIKYLQERSEYPFIKARESVFDKATLFVYLTLTCKFFDGFLVITRKLKDYFSPHLRKNCPVFHLPILVEPERFTANARETNEPYIAYCGSMQGEKDGVPDLIDAFKLTSEEFPGLKLLLIGSTHFEGFGYLQEKISRLTLDKSIIFTGIIDREELPPVLSKSVMLVLARPENKQAEAGFPTKLGEYLATGKPVVITNVGEIADYLQDGVNAFIAKPGDPNDFAGKMKYVLNHYEHALKVGAEGQHLAQTVFNYAFQGEKLVAWLKDIQQNG